MTKIINCVVSGVGGQGTVLTSKLISTAACSQGKFVRSSETIGMAQRGGCVLGHIRIGEGSFSPLVAKGTADIMLAFEPGEAIRALPYLSDEGIVITSNRVVTPITASLNNAHYESEDMISYLQSTLGNRLIVVDASRVDEVCGSQKALNVTLLGAACASGALEISLQEARDAIIYRVPERFHKMNFAALELGASFV
jgi:indolepyruvate ferredoxin oxidoreductase, beta subunit